MNKTKTSLKDAFKAAAAGSAAIGVAASIGMTAAIGPLGVAASAVGVAAASLTFGFRKKPAADVIEALTPAAEEIEISVETGAPVKTMKQIRLRR